MKFKSIFLISLLLLSTIGVVLAHEDDEGGLGRLTYTFKSGFYSYSGYGDVDISVSGWVCKVTDICTIWLFKVFIGFQLILFVSCILQ